MCHFAPGNSAYPPALPHTLAIVQRKWGSQGPPDRLPETWEPPPGAAAEAWLTELQCLLDALLPIWAPAKAGHHWLNVAHPYSVLC
jgi:hypothetical protein